jgi:mono/diheme cytochrome c family protein
MSIAIVIGVQLIILGVALFLLTPAVHRRWPTSFSAIAVARSAALIAGIIIVASDVVGGETPMSRTANPVPGTVTSVESGRALYEANCAACHGVDGHGGGPLSGTTAVTPPSLTAHLSGHSDGDLFYWISNGMPGGMPAWAVQLSETQRWDLVNYLRAINGQAPLPDGVSKVSSRPATGADPAAAAAFVGPVLFAALALSWLLGGVRRGRPRPGASREG